MAGAIALVIETLSERERDSGARELVRERSSRTGRNGGYTCPGVAMSVLAS